MPSKRSTLVVVDDEQTVLQMIERVALRAAFDVISCASGPQALEILSHRPADLVMVDLRMPEVNGLDVLRAIREKLPTCSVIAMSRSGDTDGAVDAIKLGAMDYLTKPFDCERLRCLLNLVREEKEGRRRLLAIESDLASQLEFCGMVGRSGVMQEMFSLIRRLAPHVRNVLITGEPGTGKELVARALHRLSPRSNRRFVTVNCSALVGTLFESELFGHTRGAFTGATETTQGLFDLADQGTLFLDEVGELPLTTQDRLLRRLEDGEVQRVGSLESRRIDVCVFAATSRDLRAELAAGRFRNDLFHRLNVVEVRLPPLRERREDIPYLTAALIRTAQSRLRKSLTGVTPGADRILVSANWEGNVRELRNVIERACILAQTEFITERELQGILRFATAGASGGPVSIEPPVPIVNSGVEYWAERDQIVQILKQVNGNKRKAADMLGVSRRAFYRRLERHQLQSVISRRREPRNGIGVRSLPSSQ